MGKNKKNGSNKRKNFEKFSLKRNNFKQKNETKFKSELIKTIDVEMKNENELTTRVSHDIKNAIKDNSCKVFNKEFRKVVAESDILLEILDARDPLGTRSTEIEKVVDECLERKPIIIVLNKADLVSTDNLRKWIKYFKTIYPAVPFKSSTQKQNANLGSKSFKSIKDGKYLQSSVSFGGDILMSMLGKYFRHKGAGVKITVGVVGIPNVGKSSVINSLARGKRCAIGCKPGVTRSLQKIQIDKRIMLLDSPGIIFPNANSLCSVYQNGQNVSDIKDPMPFAENVLKRASKEYFCNLYGITDFTSFEEFLAKKALKMGKFVSGTPDIEAAARSLLNDWNSGKIRYCTEPPEETAVTHISAKIISSDQNNCNGNSTDVNMNDFEEDIENVLKQFDEKPVPSEMTFNVPEQSKYQISDDNIDIDIKHSRSKVAKIDPALLLEGNRTINKDIKRLQKKKKKMFARTEKKIDQMSNVLEGFSIKTENCMVDDD